MLKESFLGTILFISKFNLREYTFFLSLIDQFFILPLSYLFYYFLFFYLEQYLDDSSRHTQLHTSTLIHTHIHTYILTRTHVHSNTLTHTHTQAMSMDPSLKDLKAEIEYEMKISEKNQKEKILREQLESENFDFDWDAAATNVDPGESHEVLSIVD